jgi:hypothetical protein
MKKQIYAALIAAAVAGAPFAAFAQQGPRAASYNNWPGMTQDTAPASVPTLSPFEGARPSSENNWPGMSQVPAANTVSSSDPNFQGPRPSPNH